MNKESCVAEEECPTQIYLTELSIRFYANHEFSVLLIKDCHWKVMLNGVKETL